LTTGVAVEKLLPAKFAKIKSRQDALQTISSGRLDIFYPPNFGCLGLKASFSTATGVYTQNPSGGLMSVIGIYRQLTKTFRRNRLGSNSE
jgi:hypothetical protein